MKNDILTFLTCLLFILGCQQNNAPPKDTVLLQHLIHDALDTARSTKNFTLLDTVLENNKNIEDAPSGSVLADSCRLAGNLLMRTDYLQARNFYNKGLSFAKRTLKDTNMTRLILYHNIGSTYFNQKNFLKAVDYYDTVNTAIAHYRLDTITKYGKLRFNNTYETARTHLENGELGMAHIFMEEAFKISQQMPIDNDRLAQLFLNYASLLRQKQQYAQAEKMALQGISLSNQLAEGRREVVQSQLYMNLGNIMHDGKRFSEAEKYFSQAIMLFQKNEDFSDALRCYMNLGESLRQNNKLSQAENLLSEQIATLNNPQMLQQYDMSDVIGLYINRGETHYGLKQYDAAYKDFLKALEYMSFTPVLDAGERVTFPSLETFNGNRFYLLMVLNDVALVHIQQNRQGKALAVYDVVTPLINLIRRDFIGEDEKMNVSGKTRDIMEKALNVCIELYDKYHDKKYLEQAFNFSEQSKAMTLLENARLKITADLPDSVKQKLSDIKNNISEVVNKLAEDPTNSDFLNVKKQLDTEKRSIWQEVTQSLKYDGGNLLTFEQVQKHLLADDQALVEYFIEKNAGKLHTFVIRKNDSMRHIVVGIDTTFEQNIDSIYQYVTQRGNTNQASFCQRSHNLYKKLIEPIANELPNRVLIVPEYPLSKVPFEALLTKPDVRTYDSARSEKAFLLFKHSIFYNYSANLHYLMRHDSTGQSDKFLKLVAFAPSFNAPIRERIFSMQNPVELNPINNKVNEKEITTIARYVNTKLYADKSATKERLLESFQNYTAIHISTHGVLLNDAKLSFISLTQNGSDLNTQQILSLHELFGQSLSHVQLVFLSACETGISEKEDYKGEGMLSMAWGLASAGVKSFVTTLWSVDAEATSELTPHFYNNLKNASSGFKDIALTKAKIQYLDTHEKGKSNPFFWAGFILVGDTEGGYLESPTAAAFSKMPIIIGAIGILVVGWLLYRRGRKFK